MANDPGEVVPFRLIRLLEKPRSSGYVRVRFVRIDMFSSSTAARRPTEVSTIVTLVVRTLKFGRVSGKILKDRF